MVKEYTCIYFGKSQAILLIQVILPLFSFLSSSGSGFEAFVSHNGELVVAVHSKKEYYTAVVEDADILDSNWVI